MTLDWAIYYDDETVYTNEDGPVEEAPKRGVQAIAQRSDRVGVRTLSGHDFYWWEDDTWFGGDKFGLFDHLSLPGEKVVFFGRSMRDDEFRELLKKIQNDDFPEKSGFESTERNPEK